MTKILATALFVVLVGALAVHELPREQVARSTAVQPSFDIAMPAAQEESSATLVTAVDAAGAARNE